jgi:ABC-type oligopeptide transport system ATPase subunit
MTKAPVPAGDCLVSVRNLSHGFSRRAKGGDGRSPSGAVLKDICFDVGKGDCLGIVGESGAGKTTLSRCLLRLIEPTAGTVLYRGEDVLSMSPRELAGFRRKAQIVFQDPFGSLNPRFRAGPMLEEVLRVTGKARDREARRRKVEELLDLVGLHVRHWGRFPHELSGGQRQRLGIARALSVEPEFLVLDEPVSALDLSVQAQILNLLTDLQDRLSLTLVLVAHDLAVVRRVAHRVAVLHAGEIVELAPVQEIFENPTHPYTCNLLETVGWK